MFRPIYKLSSPYLSLSFTHSTTLTLTVLFFHAFFLIVRCFVHSEIWTPKKKKKIPPQKIQSLHFGSFIIRPDRSRSTEDPISISLPPKCRWPNLLLLLLLHRSRAFRFRFPTLAPMAMRGVDFKWSVSSPNFSMCVCEWVWECESDWFCKFWSEKFCGFFFFLQVRWVFLVDAGDECVSFNGVLIVFLSV